ncbi:hypothetical protein ABN702_04085 [Bacillus haimaensis]|jgi:hypothetical protein|uniref:Uncharacterized protein n=1 Tax=Sutcliffiella tianshenii TaxID=1463404 RepID=A0ABS2P175_9BACI|nr:hypothetical protein [Bacillus tianshenii]MBM7620353.1 hypothetical protein [Bacillus tianshenii]MCA1318853.1 hypothetical protein [Bacillus tianshenii]
MSMTSTSTFELTCFWFIVVDREQKERNRYRVAQLVDYKNKTYAEVSKWFETLFQEYSVIKVGRGTIPSKLKKLPYIQY